MSSFAYVRASNDIGRGSATSSCGGASMAGCGSNAPVSYRGHSPLAARSTESGKGNTTTAAGNAARGGKT
ncbi:unnamed protein product, partial [Iphiclides podalirius]